MSRTEFSSSDRKRHVYQILWGGETKSPHRTSRGWLHQPSMLKTWTNKQAHHHHKPLCKHCKHFYFFFKLFKCHINIVIVIAWRENNFIFVQVNTWLYVKTKTFHFQKFVILHTLEISALTMHCAKFIYCVLKICSFLKRQNYFWTALTSPLKQVVLATTLIPIFKPIILTIIIIYFRM